MSELQNFEFISQVQPNEADAQAIQQRYRQIIK